MADKYPKPAPQLEAGLLARLTNLPRAPKALQPRVAPGQPTMAWALRGLPSRPPPRRPKRIHPSG